MKEMLEEQNGVVRTDKSFQTENVEHANEEKNAGERWQ